MEAFRAMISDGDIGVSSAASMLHTSRSTFQYVKRAPCRRLKTDEIEKRKLIEKLAGENITYGYRRIWALLRRQGIFISRNRVRRIMGEMHLLREAHFPRPRLPQTGNLISDVPDVRWYTDITCIETTDFGSCSFIEIEDSCTRDIRAWDFLVSCGASEAFVSAPIPPAATSPYLMSVITGLPSFNASGSTAPIWNVPRPERPLCSI